MRDESVFATLALARQHHHEQTTPVVGIINPTVHIAGLHKNVASLHTQFLIRKNQRNLARQHRDVVKTFLFVNGNVGKVAARRNLSNVETASRKAFPIGVARRGPGILANIESGRHCIGFPKANDSRTVQFDNIATRAIGEDNRRVRIARNGYDASYVTGSA